MDYKVWDITYDRNGNVTTLNRNAFQNIPLGIYRQMDELSYTYTANSNKLNKAVDNVMLDDFGDKDFKTGQATDNYNYNEIGELISDINESNYYTYDIYGKVTAVHSNSNKTTPRAIFTYDEKGFRIKKTANGTDTWYIRDANGNVISTYDYTGGSLAQKELGIFGDKRLGICNNNSGTYSYLYELSDHLGNVRSTFTSEIVTSVTTGFTSSGAQDHLFTYNSNIDISTTDHSPSGNNASVKLMPKQFSPGIFNISVKAGQTVSGSYWYYTSLGTPPAPDALLVFALDDANTHLLTDWDPFYVGKPGRWHELTFNYTFNIEWLLSY